MTRSVEKVFRNPQAHWVGNGFRVKQYFQAKREPSFLERFSPFILLDYNEPFFFPASPFETGVGPHPHRGFETVTFALAGKVEHTDNQGNHGVIEPGDIQWMTAGAGILHKEYHETEFAKKDRVLHMIQLWVNLPQKDKLTEPDYQAIVASDMGHYMAVDLSYEAIIYAGEAFGVAGPAKTFSPMNIYKVTLTRGGIAEISEPSDYNVGLLVLAGSVSVNDDLEANHSDFVLFKNDGTSFELKGLDDHAEFFILSGKPLDEPVFKQGPFVMSTREEVRQAQLDFESGKFGNMVF